MLAIRSVDQQIVVQLLRSQVGPGQIALVDPEMETRLAEEFHCFVMQD